MNRQIVTLALQSTIDRKALPYYVMGFFASIGTGIIVPVLPEVKSFFGVSYGEAGLMMSAFGLAKLLLDLPVAFLADRWNKVSLMVLGALVLSAGGMVGSLSSSFPIVVMARGVMGAGVAILMTTATVSVSEQATIDNRGRRLGLFSAWNLVGTSFGPSIGGYLAMLFDWRATFISSALAALVASVWIVLARRHLLPSREAVRKEDTGLERKGGERYPPRIARRPVAFALWGFCLLIFASQFARIGFLQSQVALYGSIELGLDLAALGGVLTVSSLATALALFPSGFLSDKYGRMTVLIPGIASLALGVLWVSFSSDMVQFLLAACLVGMSTVVSSILIVMVADQSPRATASRNIGLIRFMMDGGMFAGPVGLGILTDHLGFRAPSVLAFVFVVATAVFVLTFARLPSTDPEVGGVTIDRHSGM